MRYVSYALAVGVLLSATLAPVPTEVAEGAGTPTNFTLFGTHQNHPLLSGGVIQIPWPGDGTITRDGDTDYALGDHLNSNRIIRAGGDRSGFIEYAPYGAPASGVLDPRYAGHPYDARRHAYRTPNRDYDPVAGRFLSVDPARRPGHPYSYADNNPIGYLDPDGRWPLHFYLYSRFGVEIPDTNGDVTSLRESVASLADLVVDSGPRVVMAMLENTRRTPLPGNTVAEHLTLTAHGSPGSITVMEPDEGMEVVLSGRAFTDYLHTQLWRQFGPEVGQNLRSITFDVCAAGCRTRSLLGPGVTADSFADRFAGSARSYFPRLEHVIASPYDVGIASFGSSGSPRLVHVGVFSNRTPGEGATIYHNVGSDQFFAGRYPTEVFDPPHWRTPTIHGMGEYDRSTGDFAATTDRSAYGDLLRTYSGEFSEPIFRQIPVLPPPVLPGE